MPRVKPRVPYIVWILWFYFHPTKTVNNTLDKLIVQYVVGLVCVSLSLLPSQLTKSQHCSSLPGWSGPPVAPSSGLGGAHDMSEGSHFPCPSSSLLGSGFGFCTCVLSDCTSFSYCTCIHSCCFLLSNTCRSCSQWLFFGVLDMFRSMVTGERLAECLKERDHGSFVQTVCIFFSSSAQEQESMPVTCPFLIGSF